MDHEYDVDDRPEPGAEQFDEIEEMDPLHPIQQYNQERARQKRLLIIRRRRLRDISDPYDVTYEAFVHSYRLSQELVFSLIRLIRPHVRRTVSPLAVPLELKVLCTLSFYANGSYQNPTGRGFDCPVAQQTMSDYIEEITEALNQPEVVGRLIRFPQNRAEAEICIQRNKRLGGKLPDVVGYTDCTLFKIMKARFPGATNDSFILNGSSLRRKMQELYAERPCHLLGDSGYALEPWMLISFARNDQPQDDTPEARYNVDHCSDRNCVERGIGLFKNRLRSGNDERVLHYKPAKACRFVMGLCVLHNLAVLANLPHFMDLENARNEIFNEDEPQEDLDDQAEHRDDLQHGRAVRAQIVNYLEHHRHR